MFGDPGGTDLGRGEPAERAVRPVRVVLDPPGFDNDLGFEERAELFDVEQFVAGTAVEALDPRVLPRRTGFDVADPDARQATPVAQRVGDELGPVVARKKLGGPYSSTSRSSSTMRSSAVQ